MGDDVLRTLGNILSTQLRNSSDMAARLGGDEFAVLCFGDINEQTLHDVAERIHGQIGKAAAGDAEGPAALYRQLRIWRSASPDDSGLEDPFTAEPTRPCAKPRHAGKDRISFGRSHSKTSVTARLRALSPQPPALRPPPPGCPPA